MTGANLTASGRVPKIVRILIIPFLGKTAYNVYGDKTMDGTNIFLRGRQMFCILLLQVILIFMLSACITTSCEMQAVAGGSAACEETSR
jgi:hypothetical protein